MDQIANMINMIKNAGRVEHESVTVPYSNIKFAIAECLAREGFIKSVAKKTKKGFPTLELTLASSRRIYKGVKEIRPTKSTRSIVVLTTPKGILTDKEAKREMVGGEVLFTLW